MNIKRITKNLFAFAMLLILTMSAQASHWIAGNFEIKYDSTQSKYRVRMYWYNDCGGISSPTSIIANATSSCGSQNITLIQIQADVELGITPGSDGTPVEGYYYSNVCPLYQQCSECYNRYNGGLPPACTAPNMPIVPFPGMELFIYEGFVVLPPCSGWTISYTGCCRSSIPPNYLSNLNNPTFDNWYIDYFLDNNFAINNSSPEFINKAFDQNICDNSKYEYSFEATDVDGDSLVYVLIPLQNIIYNPGYTPTNFILTEPGTGGVYFDNSTGYLSFTPLSGVKQLAFFNVKIDEYRNGVNIGSVIKDMQLLTSFSCNESNDSTVYSLVIPDTSSQYIDSTKTIITCLNDTLNFTFMYFDTNNTGYNKILNSNFNTVFNGGNVDTLLFNANSAAQFSWIASDTLDSTFTVDVLIDACPVGEEYSFNYNIKTKVCNTPIQEMLVAKTTLTPNPFKNELEVMCSNIFNTIIIFDAYGRKVFERNTSAKFKELINVENLENGLYYIQLKNKNEIIGLEKLIKN